MALERDNDNLTFVWGMDFLGSERGRRFLEQKYRPRIDALKRYFGPRFTEIELLDIGIGYGMFLKAAEEEGLSRTYGMDPFPKSIEIARGNTSAKIVRGDIADEEWPLERNGYDAMTCMDVVEHLTEPALFFERVKRYLHEGGVVLVTTPNKSLPYIMRSIPLVGFRNPNPTHINVRRPSYRRDLTRVQGFEIIEEWRGEHLTHIRLIPKVLTFLCRIFKLDHRRIPIVNAFEQSYCMVLKPFKET